MKDYPLERGFEQFLKAVESMLETDYNIPSEIKALYKKEPFKARKEVQEVSFEQIKQEPVYVDNHGAIYRFLRRVKRFIKKIITKGR